MPWSFYEMPCVENARKHRGCAKPPKYSRCGPEKGFCDVSRGFFVFLRRLPRMCGISYPIYNMAEDLLNIDNQEETPQTEVMYDESSIRHLDDTTHIRTRPGMYIGRLGDGSHSDDGIYVLLKETIDNSIDEFKMNAGKRIEIELIDDKAVTVRDFGRGIPLGALVDAVSMLNTGGKYDSKAFKKSVGMNGVGSKAVNALSSRYEVRSHRDGKMRTAIFEAGKLISDTTADTQEENGTYVYFHPDETLFKKFRFHTEFIETMLRNYTYLNIGLSIIFNGRKIQSRNGLEDLLTDNMTTPAIYPIVHLTGTDIEIAFTHTNQYGEEYYSFVNGQHTTMGGTHQSAFKEHVAKTLKEFYGKDLDFQDIRNGIVGAIAVNIEEPQFESQTKIKLGSLTIGKEGTGTSVNKFVGDFIKENLDNYLHKNPDIANAILEKIQQSEKERKAIAGVTKLARERSKKASLHNRKLRDCHIHYNDARGDKREESCIFITEGDSASGTITKCRDAKTQAVFSLRGKPLNSFGQTKKTVYENDEFYLLQSALNIEDGLDGLRYNKVIVATDADVDGMHIRLLITTFFLQFFPELIKKGHVYILQTPLFRVRNKKKNTAAGKKRIKIDDNAAGADVLKKKRSEGHSEYETVYCYTDEERREAIQRLQPNPEITRFKGLGEIDPDEFKHFIGPEMRLDPITLNKSDNVGEMLAYYMGKNTSERQNFIIENLVVEEDHPEYLEN